MDTPIVSKMFCSSSRVMLMIRKRPQMVNGGGFVVTDCQQMEKIVFKADGCGILGRKGELILRDPNNHALLLIHQQQGKVQALNTHRQWKGFIFDYEGLQKLVFSLKEPKAPFVKVSSGIRIQTQPKASSTKDWDFEVKGSFTERACSIIDFKGNIAAQVKVNKEVEKLMGSKDVYNVVVNPGVDQAFVIGVIAVLDYIYHESTSC